MTAFRLALMNPNTDVRHTEAMRGVAAEALGPGCEVIAHTAARGPASIESATDHVVAAAEVAAMVRAVPEADAYLVACFGDPGVEAARELTDAPVVGIGEAAFQAVCLVAKRFAVITTLARGVPELEDAVERYGMTRRCAAILPLGIPVSSQGPENPASTGAIVAVGRRATVEHGAEALVLACGAMSETAREVSHALGIPVCDGVSVGALLGYGLWRCGLRTSKAAAWGWPEPIPYLGMPAMAEVDVTQP